jgi:hypothetical protein
LFVFLKRLVSATRERRRRAGLLGLGAHEL